MVLRESKQMKDIPMPRFHYDEGGDVMYISFGDPQKCSSEELEDGMTRRYNLKGELSGITIVNYSRRVKKDGNQDKNKRQSRD